MILGLSVLGKPRKEDSYDVKAAFCYTGVPGHSKTENKILSYKKKKYGVSSAQLSEGLSSMCEVLGMIQHYIKRNVFLSFYYVLSEILIAFLTQ